MTYIESSNLHMVCELERTKSLIILAMSVTNPQLAGFLLTQNRSNFLYECPHRLSAKYIADQCLE